MKPKKYCPVCRKEFFDDAISQCPVCGAGCAECGEQGRDLSGLIEDVKRDFEGVKLEDEGREESPGRTIAPEPDNSPVDPGSFSSGDTGFDLAQKLNAEIDPFDVFDMVTSGENAQDNSPAHDPYEKSPPDTGRPADTPEGQGPDSAGASEPVTPSLKKALDAKSEKKACSRKTAEGSARETAVTDDVSSTAGSALIAREEGSGAEEDEPPMQIPHSYNQGLADGQQQPGHAYASDSGTGPGRVRKERTKYAAISRYGSLVLLFVLLVAGYLAVTRFIFVAPPEKPPDPAAVFELETGEGGPLSADRPAEGTEGASSAAPEAARPDFQSPAVESGGGIDDTVSDAADAEFPETRHSVPSGRAGGIAPPHSGYFVSTYSYRKESNASRQAERLRRFGYPIRIRAVDLPAQGTWYRVAFGPFSTRKNARRAQKAFVSETGISDTRIIREQ